MTPFPKELAQPDTAYLVLSHLRVLKLSVANQPSPYLVFSSSFADKDIMTSFLRKVFCLCYFFLLIYFILFLFIYLFIYLFMFLFIVFHFYLLTLSFKHIRHPNRLGQSQPNSSPLFQTCTTFAQNMSK